MTIFCMKSECVHIKLSQNQKLFRHGLRYRGTCTLSSIEIGADNSCGQYEWDYKKYNPFYLKRGEGQMANKTQGSKKETKKPKGEKKK